MREKGHPVNPSGTSLTDWVGRPTKITVAVRTAMSGVHSLTSRPEARSYAMKEHDQAADLTVDVIARTID
jgi:hypothetical protein